MKRTIKSFKHALHGIYDALLIEHNFRVMTFLVVISAIIGFYFNIEVLEVIALVIIGVLMLVVELINTAFEKSLDLITKHHDDNIRYIKDIMAGAALIVSSAWLLILILIIFR